MESQGPVTMATLSPMTLMSQTTPTCSSQLNVTVSPEMHNGTVKCIHDTLNARATSVLVGAYTLILATGIHAKHN